MDKQPYSCQLKVLGGVGWDKNSGNFRNIFQGVPVLGGLALLQFFFLQILYYNFFFFRFQFIFFFFSFFFLLESNVMNTVLDTVSICLVERNISVLIYFDVPFQGISGFLKKIKNNIYLYLYFLIQYKIIDPNK